MAGMGDWLTGRTGGRPEMWIRQNSFGTFDVVLQVDGGYPSEMDALRALGVLRAELRALLERELQLRGESDAAGGGSVAA